MNQLSNEAKFNDEASDKIGRTSSLYFQKYLFYIHLVFIQYKTKILSKFQVRNLMTYFFKPKNQKTTLPCIF